MKSRVLFLVLLILLCVSLANAQPGPVPIAKPRPVTALPSLPCSPRDFVSVNSSGDIGICKPDGSGWTVTPGAGAGSPAGSDMQVQFNDGGSTFGGDAGLTYNKTTDVLTAVGGFVGALTGNVTGNVSGTAGNLSGTPALPNGTTATTQSQADASTKLATTAYVDTGLAGKQPTLTNSAGLRAALSDENGTGVALFDGATSPTFVTPALGTPSALVGTNITGTAAGLTAGTVTTNANLTGDVTSVGNATAIASGVIVNADVNTSAAIDATKLVDGTVTSAELQFINTLSSNAQTQIDGKQATLTNSAGLRGALSDENGSGVALFDSSTSATFVTPILGTPTSVTLTNGTGLPISTGVSGLGTGVATFLATPSSTNFAAAVTGETGTGNVVFSADPVFTGTPSMPTGTTATTQSPGDNTTKLATTAFVAAAVTASGLPVTDTTGIAKGSADATKIVRLEVDGFTTGTTRVVTPPNADTSLPVYGQTITYSGPTAPRTVTYPDANFTVARTDAANTFTGTQTFSGTVDIGAQKLLTTQGLIKANSTGVVAVRNTADTAYSNLAVASLRTNDSADNATTTVNLSGSGSFATINAGLITWSSSATQSNTAQDLTISRNAAGVVQFGTGSTANSSGSATGAAFIAADFTNITTGTTGAQTINKRAGSVNFAAAATSLVVTNSTVATTSIIMCTVATNDTTLKSVQCVPGSGSFTIFAGAAATAETRVAFHVVN